MVNRLAVLPVMLAVSASSPVAQQPVFSSRIEAVRVDVLVTENGSLVRGLKPQDFEVLDNGVLQQVDLASVEEIPLNVVLALDMSASVDGLRLMNLQAAGKRLLDGLKPTDQAALINFSHLVVGSATLTADVARVRQALDDAAPAGHTALVDASYAGMMVGESDAGRSLLIIFSDGVDTASWLTPDSVLDTARRSDVVVYGVEVGTQSATFQRELIALTGGRLIGIASTKDLGATFSAILDEFRLRYLISYSPRGVSRDGWHRVDVRVKGRNANVKARPGYLAGF